MDDGIQTIYSFTKTVELTVCPQGVCGNAPEAVWFSIVKCNRQGYRWEAWSCPASWDDTES
uniref:Uncharacterized protein n=1 Tax=Oryza rufipogon TaxID=4529 RepID=A0A0E0PZP9_ORYRU